MMWSQLKKRTEENFADSVVGRVEVWNTRYRRSHDEEGEAWITIDKQRVVTMGTYTYFAQLYAEADRRRKELGSPDVRDLEQRATYHRAWSDAKNVVHDRGVFSMSDVNSALFESLSLSIDNAIKSDNPIIRAFATLDRRFGKRRLAEFYDTEEHPLVRTLLRFRREAEGINADHDPPNSTNTDVAAHRSTDLGLPGSSVRSDE